MMIITGPIDTMTPSQHITNYIAELSYWRGELIDRLRKLALETVPDLREEWKWDIPIWSQKGNILTVSVFKGHVRLNFLNGADLDNPHGFFNVGLDAKSTLVMDLSIGDNIDEAALKKLIRSAIAYNLPSGKRE